MKILIIGASGILGSYLTEELNKRHEVITAGRNSGDVRFDMSDTKALTDVLENKGPFDAIAVAAGHAYFGALDGMTEENLIESLNSKLLGQVKLVLYGQHTLSRGSSITLISGILADDPVDKSSALAMVNGGINAFVKAASRELAPRGIRLNVVSPGLVEPSAANLGPLFPGHVPVSMKRVVAGYLKSIEGNINGEVIRVQ
jgi:NAD(P)-dependent dehydrogenase (short-subunit alcohol dehydrogenase family)